MRLSFRRAQQPEPKQEIPNRFQDPAERDQLLGFLAAAINRDDTEDSVNEIVRRIGTLAENHGGDPEATAAILAGIDRLSQKKLVSNSICYEDANTLAANIWKMEGITPALKTGIGTLILGFRDRLSDFEKDGYEGAREKAVYGNVEKVFFGSEPGSDLEAEAGKAFSPYLGKLYDKADKRDARGANFVFKKANEALDKASQNPELQNNIAMMILAIAEKYMSVHPYDAFEHAGQLLTEKTTPNSEQEAQAIYTMFRMAENYFDTHPEKAMKMVSTLTEKLEERDSNRAKSARDLGERLRQKNATSPAKFTALMKGRPDAGTPSPA